jgi:hypothetical protein
LKALVLPENHPLHREFSVGGNGFGFFCRKPIFDASLSVDARPLEADPAKVLTVNMNFHKPNTELAHIDAFVQNWLGMYQYAQTITNNLDGFLEANR